MAVPGSAPSLGIRMKVRRSGIRVLIEFPFPTKRQAHQDSRLLVPSTLLQIGDELPTV